MMQSKTMKSLFLCWPLDEVCGFYGWRDVQIIIGNTHIRGTVVCVCVHVMILLGHHTEKPQVLSQDWHREWTFHDLWSYIDSDTKVAANNNLFCGIYESPFHLFCHDLIGCWRDLPKPPCSALKSVETFTQVKHYVCMRIQPPQMKVWHCSLISFEWLCQQSTVYNR